MNYSRSLTVALPLFASLALLAHAAGNVSGSRPAAPVARDLSQPAQASPSKLDYVVLASVADAPNSLALYAASAHPRAVPGAPATVR